MPKGEKGHHLSLYDQMAATQAGAVLASALPEQTQDSRQRTHSY